MPTCRVHVGSEALAEAAGWTPVSPGPVNRTVVHPGCQEGKTVTASAPARKRTWLPAFFYISCDAKLSGALLASSIHCRYLCLAFNNAKTGQRLVFHFAL